MLSDAKGIYYGPREQGWATILDNRTSDYWKGLGAGIGNIAKAKAAKQKLLDDQLKNLQAEDIGRFYQGKYESELNGLFTKVQSGQVDDYGLQKELARLNLFGQRSRVVEDDFNAGIKWAESKDLPVNQSEFNAWWSGKFIEDKDQDPIYRAQNPFDKTSFLLEDGGSRIVNAGEAFKQVVSDLYDTNLVNQNWDEGNWGAAPDGNSERIMRTRLTSLPIFTKVVDDGQIEIKSQQELIDQRILETFKQNPFTYRVLLDKTKAAIAESTNQKISDIKDSDINPYDLATTLRFELEPQAIGQIKNSGALWTLRPVTGSVGDEIQFEQGLDLWTRHLRGGAWWQREQAIDYIGGSSPSSGFTVAYRTAGQTPFTLDKESLAEIIFEKGLGELTKNEKVALQNYIQDARASDGKTRAFGPGLDEKHPIDSSLVVITMRAKPDMMEKIRGDLGTDVFIIDSVRSSKAYLALFYKAALKVKGVNYHRGIYEHWDKKAPVKPPENYFDPVEGLIKSSIYNPKFMGTARRFFEVGRTSDYGESEFKQ